MRTSLKLLLLGFISLTVGACASNNATYYSFENITSVSTSHIDSIGVSASVATSFAWQYKYDDYTFLDTKYVLVDYNIDNELITWPKSEEDDDAICLYIKTDVVLEVYPERIVSFNAYISHKTHYLYFGRANGDANKAYRSLNKISDKYINKLNDKENKNGEYRLTVNASSDISPNAPTSGYYPKDYKFSFKVAIVTDVTFYVYLNDEKLISVKSDDSLGGYTYYEFLMPAENSVLSITGDRFAVDRDYTFAEVFYWANEITEENVVGIKIEDGYIGVNPAEAVAQVRYSEDKRDIEYNVNIIKNRILRPGSYNIDGGSYRKITFVMNNTEIELETYNKYISWHDFSNSKMFVLKDSSEEFFDVRYANN